MYRIKAKRILQPSSGRGTLVVGAAAAVRPDGGGDVGGTGYDGGRSRRIYI